MPFPFKFGRYPMARAMDGLLLVAGTLAAIFGVISLATARAADSQAQVSANVRTGIMCLGATVALFLLRDLLAMARDSVSASERSARLLVGIADRLGGDAETEPAARRAEPAAPGPDEVTCDRCGATVRIRDRSKLPAHGLVRCPKCKAPIDTRAR